MSGALQNILLVIPDHTYRGAPVVCSLCFTTILFTKKNNQNKTFSTKELSFLSLQEHTILVKFSLVEEIAFRIPGSRISMIP